MNATSVRQGKDRSAVLLAIFLIVLAALPYLQTFGHDFVAYDDPIYVIENPHLEHGLTWQSIGWAFATFRMANWHPVTWLSHMLDVDLWGAQAGGHHLTNVLFHAANTLLLFVVLLRMTGDMWRGALVSALFAVHPMHVESVAWISERKDVLSTFFGLLALWAYLGYACSASSRKYLLMICLFVLSLMAKAMWVTFPFLLLLLDIWPLRRLNLWKMEPQPLIRFGTVPLRHVFLEKIPLFGIAAGFGIVAVISQAKGQSMFGLQDFSVTGRISNAVVGYVLYLSKLLAPFRLTFFYPHPIVWPLSSVIVSGLVLLTVTGIAFVYRGRYPWLLIGWSWFIATLVPVIGLLQIGWQSIADRYTYIPSVGLFIMLVWSIPARLPSQSPRLSFAVASIVIALFTAKTWRQVSYWKNSRTLFTHGAQVTRGNFLAHQYLGNQLEREGDLTGALRLYEAAAAERPAYARTTIHEDIASVLIKQARYPEATSELKAALEINPNSSVAYNSMGSIMVALKENREAANYFQRAVELDPRNTVARINHGIVLVTLGRWDQAIAQLAPVVRAEPKRLVARTNLALALAGRCKYDEAIGELRQVLQIDPGFGFAQDTLREIEAQKPRPSPTASLPPG